MCPDHGSPARSARFIRSTRRSCRTTATAARRWPSGAGRRSPSESRAASESIIGDVVIGTLHDSASRRRMPPAMTRAYDVILFGATGFTGRLVADYLKLQRPRWAIAGRNRGKLEALGLGVPIIVADALDPVALRGLAEQTTVVCTTAGPFARYGSALVAACAEAGTHYCDL